MATIHIQIADYPAVEVARGNCKTVAQLIAHLQTLYVDSLGKIDDFQITIHSSNNSPALKRSHELGQLLKVNTEDKPLYVKAPSIGSAAGSVRPVLGEVEPHVNLEGVRLDDPLTLFRVDKCHKLLAEVEQHQIVLIRAPPMSGKTALGQVLEKAWLDNAGQDHEFKVYFFSLLAWDQENGQQLETAFEKRHGICLNTALFSGRKTLVIFDETQMLYQGHDSFWRKVKLMKQHQEASLLTFFAAYGETPTQSNGNWSTPIDFSSTFSASFMAFTEEEMEAYRKKFNATKWGKTSPLSPEVAKAIHHWNGGHPGLIAKTCFAIGGKFFNHAAIKTGPKTIMGFLLSSEMMAILDTTRALTGGQGTAFELKEEEKTYLKEVIHEPGLRLSKAGANQTALGLITKGILGTIDEQYIGFVSPLACSVYINRLYGKSSSAHFSSLPELLLQALPKMDKTILKSSLSRGTNGMHYERQFQVEFYRCVMEILGRNQGYCSPDVGRLFGSTGFLDFYVDSKYQWGVELVRESNRLQEHIGRFQESGIYALIPFKDHVVLDFVYKEDMTTRPGTHSEDKAVWKIYFNEEADVIYVGTRDDVKTLNFLSSIQEGIRSS